MGLGEMPGTLHYRLQQRPDKCGAESGDSAGEDVRVFGLPKPIDFFARAEPIVAPSLSTHRNASRRSGFGGALARHKTVHRLECRNHKCQYSISLNVVRSLVSGANAKLDCCLLFRHTQIGYQLLARRALDFVGNCTLPSAVVPGNGGRRHPKSVR